LGIVRNELVRNDSAAASCNLQPKWICLLHEQSEQKFARFLLVECEEREKARVREKLVADLFKKAELSQK
jgi:hypothetical protein